MKKATLYWLIFIVLVNLFLIGTSNAQDFGNLNVIDGSRSAFDTPINVSPVLSHRFTDIACKELNFWTVGIQGEILQWELSGNAVTFTDTIFQSSPVVSLAYADNLNSGSITRTFYGSNFYHGSDLYYYDGAIWDTLPFPSGPGTPNAGGYHSYLYYQALVYSSGLDAIIRFDGVSEDTIFILPAPQNFSIAEIAVDAQGNIWTMEGTQGIQSDSVIVISPSGTILQTFALNMSTLHAYGCFLLNDVFYIVFGSGNPQYPSSVVQIGFTGNQAFVQQVIPFPNNDFTDVASCIPGLPIIFAGTSLTPDKAKKIDLFPNPAGSYLKMHLDHEPEKTACLMVSDDIGREVLRQNVTSAEFTVDLSRLSKGIYHFKIISDVELYTGRFVRE